MNTTVTYDKVETRCVRDGRCPVCGRYVRRSRIFWQTISPFNQNPDGSEKTWAQVQESVEAEAEAWVPDFRHEACK